MVEPIAQLENVSRIYQQPSGYDVAALCNVSFQVFPKEIRAIVGPSGSGKTTLLHLLGLLDAPTSGTQKFLGRDVASMNEHDRTRMRAQSIAFMFQENWLIPWLTAYENVLAPQMHLGPLSKAHREQAMDLLERLGLIQHTNKLITALSGGQRQRVCMARALLKSPRLVIADEPSASLDSHTTAEILDLFLDVREQEDCAILIATHDPCLIEPLRSSLITLHDGQILS